MDLTPAEMAIVELLRAMGSEPLHLAFTSTGSGVALTIVAADAGHVAGWGEPFEDAFANAYAVPAPGPRPSPPSRFKVVAGTDRGRSST